MLFKTIKNSKRGPRVGIWSLACLLAAGCVLAPSGEDADTRGVSADQDISPSVHSAPSAPELPNVDLDGDLLYKILVGEIAANRGNGETAVGALVEAARLSRDPRLAQRATRVALDAERLDLALESASLWVELQPDRDRPLESLALIMVEQGRINEADARFATLLRKHSEDRATAMRRIARLLGQLSNREHVLAAMKRIVARYEDDADAHFAAAFLADRIDRNELVIESLDRALSLRPGWEEAGLAKLGHLIQNKYPKKRIDTFARRFLEESPDATRVRVGYARYLIDQEATDNALKQFLVALKHDPGNTASLMAAGLLSVQDEHYKDARKYFLRHLELTPGNDRIRLYLGQIADEQERYAEAEKWYRQVSGHEHRFDARLRLATVIFEREGVDSALGHLDTVVPGDEDEFVRLSLTKEVVLRDAGKLARAKSVLDDAVARYPDNTDLLYSRGLLAAQLDRLGEHERDMRTLLAENPNDAHALNALGYTLADATDRIQEAYELIKKALGMRPDDPFVLDSMGWVQYRLGNLKDAIGYLERALSMRQDAEIAAHLGEVLWVTGAEERAREIWKQAREEHPESDILNETLERFIQ
ncbi:MAG: Beta-barrel assembly-enhancing protease [Gammaproteobacteria bacterium]|nr:Beta-barrel assembly-enhancing protease [Gammaproteobacteria bacterium]